MKLIALAILAAAAFGQPIKLPASFETLGKKAKEKVDISLDKSMIGSAASFLGGKDSAEAQKAMSKLEGIYIRSFEFEKAGEYDLAEVVKLEQQLDASKWKKIVNVEDNEVKELVQIFMNSESKGMVIIAAEPNELAIVQLVGSISLADLGNIKGIRGFGQSFSSGGSSVGGKSTPPPAKASGPAPAKPAPARKEEF